MWCPSHKLAPFLWDQKLTLQEWLRQCDGSHQGLAHWQRLSSLLWYNGGVSRCGGTACGVEWGARCCRGKSRRRSSI